MSVCKPGEFAKVVSGQLHVYSAHVTSKTAGAVEQTAQEAADELKQTSPRRKGKGGGAYARSWAVKKDRKSMFVSEAIVHNKNHYQLTHLLEHGHATPDGTGRTKAYPHIEKAEKSANARLLRRVEEAIESD